MSALHRSPPVVGVAAAVLVGGIVHYWFATPALSVAVGLLYFATGYFVTRFENPTTRFRGLPPGAAVVGVVGLVAAVVAIVGSASVFGLTERGLYTYVIVAVGFALFNATLAVEQAD
ncbi:hypothetical protein GCM10009037_21130 [Halarchaeum grantii]|uniref:Uncharacterized protein n=1 Tax=Halarchaeum grantii TaxID=1193105 RepID=A0A830FB44_9EURY|nr:hypothetical protein [Halarchaeum grantii]GGL37362.1 hypothetical protein GCM10009037_21130 [Halarchaeum grantii]